MSNRCRFNTWYYDYGTWLNVPYWCDEAASHSSSYCLFHDQGYWKYDSDRIKKRLAQKVEAAKQSNEALFCIGYNLFEIRLSDKFEAPVYFDFAKFHMCPFFIGTTFDVASFEGARFEGPAVFQEVTFRKADFKHATFNDEANFKRAVFEKLAYFKGTTFDVASFEGARFEGPAVFQEVTFRKADFKHATFNDEANFQRAVFREHDFAQCKFLTSTKYIRDL